MDNTINLSECDHEESWCIDFDDNGLNEEKIYCYLCNTKIKTGTDIFRGVCNCKGKHDLELVADEEEDKTVNWQCKICKVFITQGEKTIKRDSEGNPIYSIFKI